MNGTYVSPTRVIRNGLLVAFAGERMSMAEAERRGLLEPPAKDGGKAGAGPSAMTRAQLVEYAAAHGVDVPARARKDEILRLIGA